MWIHVRIDKCSKVVVNTSTHHITYTWLTVGIAFFFILYIYQWCWWESNFASSIHYTQKTNTKAHKYKLTKRANISTHTHTKPVTYLLVDKDNVKHYHCLQREHRFFFATFNRTLVEKTITQAVSEHPCQLTLVQKRLVI